MHTFPSCSPYALRCMHIRRHHSPAFRLVHILLLACLVFMAPLHAGTVEEFMSNAEASYERLDIVDSMAW